MQDALDRHDKICQFYIEQSSFPLKAQSFTLQRVFHLGMSGSEAELTGLVQDCCLENCRLCSLALNQGRLGTKLPFV